MTHSMNMVLRHGWQQFRRNCAALAARLPRRADMLDGASRLRRGVANVVFPSVCPSCHTMLDVSLTERDAAFCPRCVDEMEVFAGPTCERCSAPIPAALSAPHEGLTPVRRVPGCYHCRGRKLWFDETIALGHYDGRLRDAVLRMKDAAGDALSLAIARFIWQIRGERLTALGADVVVPIPLHWQRRIAHRTNSSALLAEVLAAKLRLPRADGLLRRTRATHKQFDLSPTQRWENVRRAFAVRAGYHLENAHVLVCDDILTTGATCSEAARALREAGAARVSVVVAARTLGEA